MTMTSISTSELKALLQTQPNTKVIDVRSPAEFAGGSVPGAVNIPTEQVLERKAEFMSDQPVYVMCQSGTRSRLVVLTLQAQGLTHLINVSGGMSNW